MYGVKIECPKCRWKPDGGPHWQCSCGITWNTFDTAGQCPSCGKQWEHTCCPTDPGGCGKWSPHVDWYKDLDEWLKEEVAHLNSPVYLASTILSVLSDLTHRKLKTSAFRFSATYIPCYFRMTLLLCQDDALCELMDTQQINPVVQMR